MTDHINNQQSPSITGTADYQGNPDHLALVHCIEMFENEIHDRCGWNNSQEALLYRLELGRVSKTSTTETTTYYGEVMDLRDTTYKPQSADKILELLATLLESPLSQTATLLDMANGTRKAPIAHLLISRVYVNADAVAVNKARREESSLDNLPGTKEARISVCVIDSDTLIYCRVKGEEPLWVPPHKVGTYSNDIIRDLRRIHYADVRNWSSEIVTPQTKRD